MRSKRISTDPPLPKSPSDLTLYEESMVTPSVVKYQAELKKQMGNKIAFQARYQECRPRLGNNVFKGRLAESGASCEIEKN